MDIEVWHRTRNVNLDGAFYITQAVARQMKEQVPQGGSIIGISSISALVGGGQQVYVHARSPRVNPSLMHSLPVITLRQRRESSRLCRARPSPWDSTGFEPMQSYPAQSLPTSTKRTYRTSRSALGWRRGHVLVVSAVSTLSCKHGHRLNIPPQNPTTLLALSSSSQATWQNTLRAPLYWLMAGSSLISSKGSYV